MLIRCQNCGARVKLARDCSYCGISHIERLHLVLVRLSYLCGMAALFTAGVAFLGKSAETFRHHADDSGLPSQEEVGEGPAEVPWIFAKEMSEAVGREVTGTRDWSAPPDEY
jgi:hypothetical protein